MFTDASHGGERPMGGYVSMCNGGPVTWECRRLPLTPLSSCEAEYVGATRAATAARVQRGIMQFMGFNDPRPTLIMCDNMSAVLLSDNNTSSKRMRHIATRIAFLREAVQSKEIMLYHIRTTGQLADIFTKPLAAATFHDFRHVLLA